MPQLAKPEPLEASSDPVVAPHAPTYALREILFPTDLSPESDRALEHAALIARRFGARLTLYHVLHCPWRDEPEEPGDPRLEVARRAEALAREHIERRASELETPRDLVVERASSVHRTLLRTIADRRPDLTVMATHGRDGLAHLLLGSVAETVVQHGGSPVLCVREPEHGVALPYRRVLVPTDLSLASRRAFPLAALLARGFGAEVIAVHVARPPAAPLTGVTHAVERSVPAEERVREFLLPEFGGLLVQPRVLLGSAWDRIVATARLERADVIVMSTHGHDSLADRVIGSHAERVSRHAPCPVLVV